MAELSAAHASDSLDAILRLSHALARNATQQQATEAELGQHLDLQFVDLLTVVRPVGEPHLLVDKPGHKLVSEW